MILSTTKPDKYDRSLADVFVRRNEAGGERSTSSDRSADSDAPARIFLNNVLLENGHAVRYDGAGPKEE